MLFHLADSQIFFSLIATFSTLPIPCLQPSLQLLTPPTVFIFSEISGFKVFCGEMILNLQELTLSLWARLPCTTWTPAGQPESQAAVSSLYPEVT